MKQIAFMTLLITVVSSQSFAQSGTESRTDTTMAGKTCKFILKDGGTIFGVLEAGPKDSIMIALDSGTRVMIPEKSIAKVEVIEAWMSERGFTRADPNGSRLFFSPTGRPVRGGHGYFAVYELFFPYLAFGIADIVTISGGISLVPGSSDQVVYLGPKITVPFGSDDFALAFGGHYLNSTMGAGDGIGILYGVATVGKPTAALTAGLGYGYAEGKFSNSPLLMLGGELQISNSTKLISENLFPIGQDFSLLSLGVRFFGESLSTDFGMYFPITEDTDGLSFLPWLGFTYVF